MYSHAIHLGGHGVECAGPVLRLRQGRQMIRLGLAAVVVAVLTASGVAHSGEPPSEPVLRIETGMHTAPIRRIDTRS